MFQGTYIICLVLFSVASISCQNVKPKSQGDKTVFEPYRVAMPGEFPFQLSVQHRGNRGRFTDFICTATLIEHNGQQVAISGRWPQFCLLTPPCVLVGGITTLNTSSVNEQIRNIVLIEFYTENQIPNPNVHTLLSIIFVDKPFEINEFVRPLSYSQHDQPLPSSVVATVFNDRLDVDLGSQRLLVFELEVVTCNYRELPYFCYENTEFFSHRSSATILNKTNNALLGIEVLSDGPNNAFISIPMIADKLSSFIDVLSNLGKWPVERKPGGGIRISQPGEAPHNMILMHNPISLYEGSDNGVSCSATLIEVEGLILAVTVESCFWDFGLDNAELTYSTLIAGVIDMQQSSEHEQRIEMVSSVILKRHNADRFPNDAVVLIFLNNFESSDVASVLKLPSSSEQYLGPVLKSGWGKIPYTPFRATPVQSLFVPELMVGDLTVIDYGNCKTKYMNKCGFVPDDFGSALCVDLPHVSFTNPHNPNITISRPALNLFEGSPIVANGTLIGLRTNHYGNYKDCENFIPWNIRLDSDLFIDMAEFVDEIKIQAQLFKSKRTQN